MMVLSDDEISKILKQNRYKKYNIKVLSDDKFYDELDRAGKPSTVYPNFLARGLYNYRSKEIYVSRSGFKSEKEFKFILSHEINHANHGYSEKDADIYANQHVYHKQINKEQSNKDKRREIRKRDRELSKEGFFAYKSYAGTVNRPIPLSDRSSNKSVSSYDVSGEYNPLRNQIFYSQCTLGVQLDDGSMRYVSGSFKKSRSLAYEDAEAYADDFIEMLSDNYEIFADVVDTVYKDVSEDEINIDYGDSNKGIKRRKNKRASFEKRTLNADKNRRYKRNYLKGKLARLKRRISRKLWKKRYYLTPAGKAKRRQYR